MRIKRDVFTTVRSEGALLPPDLLRRIAEGDDRLGGLTPNDYHLVGERTNEAINRAWNRMLAAWQAFREAQARLPDSDPGTSITRERWLLPLFSELGYGRLPGARAIEIDGRSYPVSHGWQHTPIHLVGFRVDLDRRTAGVAGAARISPHGLVQDLLNRSDEHLWGFVSNGLKLRVLRDNASLIRQSYVEFDLESMMEGQVYADFVLLWLVCHQSRVEASQAKDCWLEKWMQVAAVQGTRALDRLREGVQRAIENLGRGFIEPRRNAALAEALRSGELSTQEYYRQLLRVVYRMLFLLVAEDRDLLLVPTATPEQRERYRRYYSMDRLRRLADKRRGSSHGDVWRGVVVAWTRLSSPEGCVDLGLPPLTGFLWAPEALGSLLDADISNADILAAVRALAFTVDDGVRRPVDFRSLGSEELGSIYESLLELQPELNVDAGTFVLKSISDERSATGSHYTPQSLIEHVLNFALDPQIERCIREKDPVAALLDLKILDPACGSGHILIAAGHRLARAVASARTGDIEPAPGAVKEALRDVVVRCLYGVDYNPMAVELCKIALWIETLEPGKPLSFLDHHIQCGNSLIGVPVGSTVLRNRTRVDSERGRLRAEIDNLASTANRLEDSVAAAEAAKQLRTLRRKLQECVYDSWADAIPDEAFKALSGDDKAYARALARRNRRAFKSQQIELGLAPVVVELPADVVGRFGQMTAGAETDAAEVTIRAKMYEETIRHYSYRHLVDLANVWTAAWFWPLTRENAVPTQAEFQTLRSRRDSLPEAMRKKADELAERWRFFHFELAFPEVFTTERGGFDLVIGNPPYLGGMKISGTYGEKVLHFLKSNHHERTGGRADLAVYFLRRGFDLLRPGGDLCFITTNTIAQGDTRDAALAPIVQTWGGQIANAVRSVPWEGDATVNVTVLHLHNGEWTGPRTLDGEEVERITIDLSVGEDSTPRPLTANAGIAFAGTNILGEGFQLTAHERESLLRDDPRNSEVIKLFMGGSEAMRIPSLVPDRWVIDFGDRTFEEASQYHGPMRVVVDRVKPDRDRAKEKRVRENWWRFGRPGANLYKAIAERRLTRVIAIPEVSKTMLPVFLDVGMIYSHKLVVFADESDQLFGELTSSFHWLWAASRCSTMRTDPTYNPTLCFMTFPRPEPSAAIANAARELEDYRRSIMIGRNIGLTKLYNEVFDPAVHQAGIVRLRDLHVALDEAVALAYGWDDLISAFHHGHHPTERFGTRWTVRPKAQREIESRLRRLNAERAEGGDIELVEVPVGSNIDE